MRTALYPGTFDPITNGHLDLVRRASGLFDRIVVAVGTGRDKHPTFTVRERVALVKEAVRGVPNVQVMTFSGLTIDTARAVGAVAIVRGLREVSDFEYEFQMALMNRRLARDVETVFLMPSESYTYLDSTTVKEVALLGGSIEGLVPECVETKLRQKRRPPAGDRRRSRR